MAENIVTVDPRYSKYNSKEMEAVFDKVHNADAEPTEESENMISSGAVAVALDGYVAKEDLKEASEEDVREIVQNWTPDAEPEEEKPGE